MISLPDISTDAGVLSRLIISECENPGYSDYGQADGKLSFRLMQATVVNRLNNNPAQFGAPGAQNFADIITATNQFAGFTTSGGQVQLSQSVSDRINAVLTNANTGNPGAYYQFVQDILDRVNSTIDDPFAGLTSLNGVAVVGGTYGWRTAGSGDPGGRFYPIPEAAGGLILGNQFYTLLPEGSAQGTSEAQQFSATFENGVGFVNFLRSAAGESGRVSLNGYVMRTENDEVILFSRNPASVPWAEIRVQQIKRVEYFGGERLGNIVYAKVRLSL